MSYPLGGLGIVSGETEANQNIHLHWRLNESSGDALDTSGNGFDGTVTGATQTGGYYTFDGVNDRVNASQSGLVTPLQSSNNFSVFVKASATSYAANTAVSITDGNNSGFSFHTYSSGGSGNGHRIWWEGEWILQDTTGLALPNGDFNNFLVTCDGATDQKLYINSGTAAQTSTTSKTSAAGTDNVSAGVWGINDSEWYNGNIQELRVYDYTISQNAIDYLMDL
mgnify:CR=1 FL=1|jgi:hypothetical protein|tara:strand:- start:3194 stop:3865 length:672 start_codon:yes stop_codon:yes gene_type:complete